LPRGSIPGPGLQHPVSVVSGSFLESRLNFHGRHRHGWLKLLPSVLQERDYSVIDTLQPE